MAFSSPKPMSAFHWHLFMMVALRFISNSMVSQIYNEPLTEAMVDDIHEEMITKHINKVCNI